MGENWLPLLKIFFPTVSVKNWLFVADCCFFPFESAGVRSVEVDGSSFDFSCFSFFFLVFLPPVAHSV